MTKHETDSGNYRLMAVVDEMRFERPRYGPPSASAKVILLDGLGGQTYVEIPVLSIVEKLDLKSRYLVEIQYRRMSDEEEFQPDVTAQTRTPNT